MLTTQPSTYGLISCNNPSKRSHWQLPWSAPIMRPHHAAPAPSTASPACRPPRPAGVARWPLAHPACAPHPACPPPPSLQLSSAPSCRPRPSLTPLPPPRPRCASVQPPLLACAFAPRLVGGARRASARSAALRATPRISRFCSALRARVSFRQLLRRARLNRHRPAGRHGSPSALAPPGYALPDGQPSLPHHAARQRPPAFGETAHRHRLLHGRARHLFILRLGSPPHQRLRACPPIPHLAHPRHPIRFALHRSIRSLSFAARRLARPSPRPPILHRFVSNSAHLHGPLRLRASRRRLRPPCPRLADDVGHRRACRPAFRHGRAPSASRLHRRRASPSASRSTLVL